MGQVGDTARLGWLWRIKLPINHRHDMVGGGETSIKEYSLSLALTNCMSRMSFTEIGKAGKGIKFGVKFPFSLGKRSLDLDLISLWNKRNEKF